MSAVKLKSCLRSIFHCSSDISFFSGTSNLHVSGAVIILHNVHREIRELLPQDYRVWRSDPAFCTLLSRQFDVWALYRSVSRAIMPPGYLLSLLSGFFALVEKDVHLLFLTGFDPRITWTVSRALPQRRRICSTPKFDAEDLERTMLDPSVQILDRFDFRSLLDFLLMQLRSACDSSWMSSFPDFQHVGTSSLHLHNCFVFLSFLRCSEDILIQFSCC